MPLFDRTSQMWVSSLVFIVVLAVTTSASGPTVTDLTPGQELSWLENLSFGGSKGLFFSEALNARVHHIAVPGHNSTVYLQFGSDMERILGVHYSIPTSTLYGVGRYHNGTCIMYASRQAGNYTIVATFPELGNGLDLHLASGLLYTSAEGSLNPLAARGAVYQVNATSGNVLTLGSHFRSTDGLWIDQERNLLYVGQLWKADVLVFDISEQPPVLLGPLSGLEAPSLLDDFTLMANGTRIVGCNWLDNRIDVFPALPSNGTFSLYTLVPSSLGIRHPTSARWGIPPFESKSLYVTEGNQFKASGTRDRLLRVDFD